MESFKFLKQNFVNTTTAISVPVGTASVVNLIDRRRSTVWQTSGYSGSTAVTIVWTPSTTQTVSRITLRNNNFEQFRIFYDGVTANVFSPDIIATSNTASDLYFEFSTQAVASVTLQIDTTFPAGNEKELGELYIGDEWLEFPHNPNSDNYNPIFYRKGLDQEMSDGGIVEYFLAKKFRAEMNIAFATETERDEFETVFDAHEPFDFIPYPINGFTTTSQWDGDQYEVVLTGDLDIFKVSSNVLGNGYNINLGIAETPL